MPDYAREWLAKYGRWAGVLVVVNLVACMGFEAFHSREIGSKDLWGIRVGLLAALLLFDNLVVLWWYADRTAAQLDLALTVRREANKPLVVTVKKVDPRDPNDYHYYINNIGPGVAVSVWFVAENPQGGTPHVHALGAVGPGDSRGLGGLESLVHGMNAASVHLLAAEGLTTRTAQWTVTANRVASDYFANVTSEMVPLSRPDRVRSVGELVKEEWEEALAPALRRG